MKNYVFFIFFSLSLYNVYATYDSEYFLISSLTFLAINCCSFTIYFFTGYMNKTVSLAIKILLITFCISQSFKYVAYITLSDVYGIGLSDIYLKALFPSWSIVVSENVLVSALTVMFGYISTLTLICIGIAFLSYRYGGNASLDCSIDLRKSKYLMYVGVVLVLTSLLLRLKLGLVMGEDSSSNAGGLSGIIVIINTYLGPTLLLYLATILVCSGELNKGKNIFLVCFTLSLLNYLFFYTKGSLLIPLFWLFSIGYIYRPLYTKKTYFSIVVIVLLLYPFMNIYRWVQMSGGDFNKLLFSSSEMLAESGFNSFIDIFILGALSIWHRIVGFDSLVVILENVEKININYIDVMFLGLNIDHYLTYDLIGFKNKMGVSPSQLGRYIFLGGGVLGSFLFSMLVSLTLVLTVYLLSILKELKYLAIVLMIYVFQISLSGFNLLLFKWWLFTSFVVVFTCKIFRLQLNYKI